MPDPKDSETEDYRQLQQFLRKEGWISHIKDYTSTEVCDLVASPTADENMDSIRKHVLSLMVHLQNMIDTAGFHVRRLIGRRPS
jgi:hypothetical protein